MKKVVSIILTLCLVISGAGLTAFAAETKTDCGGNCQNCPTVVVPGIGQSNVWALDENGDFLLDSDGDKINCFPAYFNIGSIVVRVLAPLLLTLLTQHDIGLSAALVDVVKESFAVNMCDNSGKNTGNIMVEKYPYSLAECSEYEKGEIYDAIPLQEYSRLVGEDHLYFFAYNSFGNHLDAVNELYSYIQMVKAETGHSKINLVPISMGGSIANGLLEYYPEVKNDLNKVVYIVPALNGSTIVGDVLSKDITFLNKDFLYNGFLETLMDEDDAKLVESAIRILPDEVLMKVLGAVVDSLVDDVMVNIPSIWALCPKEYYPALSKKLLSAPEKAELKRQTDMYYNAQVNSLKNIQALVDSGVEVFNIVDYDAPLYQIGNSWNDDNADGVIQLKSTSMGAHSAKVGETLPESYIQANTYCSNPEHNHISPDRVVDASTGLLPDHTFYFDGQNHEKTARNDIIIALAIKLIATDEIKDVYTSPNFPQFNGGRDIRDVKGLLADAKRVDTSALTPEVAAELNAAIADAEAMVNSTVAAAGDDERMEERLKACLVAAGARAPEEEEESSDFFANLSAWLYKNYGTNGFIEMLPISIGLMFNAFFEGINNAFNKIF